MSLYVVLGVVPEAKDIEIRRAYRKLALRLHPDKNGGVESKEWLLIQGAYEVLGDAELRKEYDALGVGVAEWFKDRDPGPRPPPGGVATDMADYLAKMQERRKRESAAFAQQRRWQSSEARRKETEDFMAEVDELIRKTSESCSSAHTSTTSETQAKDRDESDYLEAVLAVMRRKQKERQLSDEKERKRMEARMREDMETLRREWESAIDRQIDEAHEAYEAGRRARHNQQERLEKEQLSQADDMVAKAKAEMEAMMAELRA